MVATRRPARITLPEMLVVLLLERVPVGVRGDLGRWMLELRPGVFVGRVSAQVRDALWDRVRAHARTGACAMVRLADTDQGFQIETHREPRRPVEHFEGLQLVRTR